MILTKINNNSKRQIQHKANHFFSAAIKINIVIGAPESGDQTVVSNFWAVVYVTEDENRNSKWAAVKSQDFFLLWKVQKSRQI